MKKGQFVITFSIMLLFIFLLVVVLFTDYLINNPRISDEQYDRLQQEAGLVADSLLLSGYPLDWNETTVERVGFVDGGRINTTKVLSFEAVIQKNYQNSKYHIGAQHDYLILLETDAALPDKLGILDIDSEQELIDSQPKAITYQERNLLDEDGRAVKLRVYLFRYY